MIELIIFAAIFFLALAILTTFGIYALIRRTNTKVWIWKITEEGEVISKEIKKAWHDKKKGTLTVREGWFGNREVADFRPSLIRSDNTIDLIDFEGNLLPLKFKVEASDLIRASPILTPAGKKNIARDTMEVGKKAKQDEAKKMYFVSIAIFVLAIVISLAMMTIVVGSFNSSVDKFANVAQEGQCKVVIDYANLTRIAKGAPPG